MCGSLPVVSRDVSRADAELADRVGVRARQIERWREQGCLRPPQWTHPEGSAGSTSAHDGDALEQARAVRDLLAGPPVLIAGAKTSFDEVRMRLFWQRRYVDPGRLPASYLALLAAVPDPNARQAAEVRLLAAAMAGRARGTAAARAWVGAIRLANRLGRANLAAGPQVGGALTVLFAAVLGESTAAHDAVDALDNLGFDLDETVTGQDLEFLNAAGVRALVADAGAGELEAARDLLAAMLGYLDTLVYIGRRTDRSLRWPALSVVGRRLLRDRDALPAALVPFAAAARRQFLAQDPDWDAMLRRHIARAEAVASLLRALPRRLHRLIPVHGGAPPQTSAAQRRELLAVYTTWGAAHPEAHALIFGPAPDDAHEPGQCMQNPTPAAGYAPDEQAAQR